MDAEIVSGFWNAHFGNMPSSDGCLRRIIQAYSERSRHYHGLSHLAQGISLFGDLPKMEAGDEAALALGWACHDIKHNAHIPDSLNVNGSAQMAGYMAKMLGFSQEQEIKAMEAVLATAHTVVPKNTVEQSIIDLDLSILGAGKITYETYEMGIRNEYSWVPFDEYRARRTKILDIFLNRERLFWNGGFHKKYDTARRRNLEWSISLFESGVDFLKKE